MTLISVEFICIYCSLLQVTSDGVIPIGEEAIECCPIRFDRILVGASAFVAPYWIDNDPSIQGGVSYEVHEQGSPSLELVSDFISSDLSIEFSGVWMLVAFWQNVPEFFFQEQVGGLIQHLHLYLLVCFRIVFTIIFHVSSLCIKTYMLA